MPALLPPEDDLELLHTRNYETKVYYVSDSELLVRGAVRDTKPPGLYIADDPNTLDIHEMHIELRVALPGLVISDVNVLFETHPAASCPHITSHYDNLVGLSIARGFTHKVRELFGGPRGCTHVTALLQAMAPAVVQSMWSVSVRAARQKKSAAESGRDGKFDRRFASNLNTCHVWAEDGDHVAAIRRGEMPPPPLQVTDRLRELGRDPAEWRRR